VVKAVEPEEAIGVAVPVLDVAEATVEAMLTALLRRIK
jgi:L-asparaginase II